MQQRINPALLLLGNNRGSYDGDLSEPGYDVISVVSRVEIDEAPLGTPFIANKRHWESEKMGSLAMHRFFPVIPGSEGRVSRSLPKSHLRQLQLPPLLCDMDVHWVDFYDFTWIEQVINDLTNRPAIMFVSKGEKFLPDFCKNMLLTAKEFKAAGLFGIEDFTDSNRIDNDDEPLMVLTLIDPRYVLPMFCKRQPDDIAGNFRIMSRRLAERNAPVILYDMYFLLTNNMDAITFIDGERLIPNPMPKNYFLVEVSNIDSLELALVGNKKLVSRKKKSFSIRSEHYTTSTADWNNSGSTSSSSIN